MKLQDVKMTDQQDVKLPDVKMSDWFAAERRACAAYQLSIDIRYGRRRSAVTAGSVMLRAEVRGSSQT